MGRDCRAAAAPLVLLRPSIWTAKAPNPSQRQPRGALDSSENKSMLWLNPVEGDRYHRWLQDAGRRRTVDRQIGQPPNMAGMRAGGGNTGRRKEANVKENLEEARAPREVRSPPHACERACVRSLVANPCAASASAWVRARGGAGTDPRLAGQGGPDDGQRDGGPDAEVALPAAELVHAQASRARHRHGGEDDAAAVPEVLVAADPAVAVLVDDGEERVHVGRLPVLREQAPPQLGRRYHAVPVHVDQVELLRERFSVHIAFMHVTVRTSYHTPEHTAPADLVDPGFESWASPFRGENQEWCIGWNKSHRAGSVVLR